MFQNKTGQKINWIKKNVPFWLNGKQNCFSFKFCPTHQMINRIKNLQKRTQRLQEYVQELGFWIFFVKFKNLKFNLPELPCYTLLNHVYIFVHSRRKLIESLGILKRVFCFFIGCNLFNLDNLVEKFFRLPTDRRNEIAFDVQSRWKLTESLGFRKKVDFQFDYQFCISFKKRKMHRYQLCVFTQLFRELKSSHKISNT